MIKLTSIHYFVVTRAYISIHPLCTDINDRTTLTSNLGVGQLVETLTISEWEYYELTFITRVSPFQVLCYGSCSGPRSTFQERPLQKRKPFIILVFMSDHCWHR